MAATIGELITLADTRARRDVQVEIGHVGTVNQSGRIAYEYLSELKTPTKRYDTYQRMRSDAAVSGLLAIIMLPLQAAAYTVVPNPDDGRRGKEIAERIETALLDMKNTRWDDFVREAYMMIAFGFSLFEPVWAVNRDKLLVPDKIATRAQNTITQWNVNEKGDLISVHQQVTSSGGGFNGDIPAELLLRFSYRQEAGNYEGRPITRDAYMHWWIKQQLYHSAGINAERTGVGLPIGKIPDDQFKRNQAQLENLLRAIRGHQEGAAVIPSSWDISLLEGKPFQHVDMIDHHNRMIAMTGLATFLHLGSSSSGSFALSKTQGQFFVMALKGILQYFLDVVSDGLIRKMVDYNWGENVPAPYLQAEMLLLDPLEVADALASLTREGIIIPDKGLRNIVRERILLPPEPDDLEPEKTDGKADDGPVEETVAGRFIRRLLEDPHGAGLRVRPTRIEMAERGRRLRERITLGPPRPSALDTWSTKELGDPQITVTEERAEWERAGISLEFLETRFASDVPFEFAEHDPRAKDELWRALTKKEEDADFLLLKAKWTAFEDDAAQRVGAVLDPLVVAYLTQVIIALRVRNPASILNLELRSAGDVLAALLTVGEEARNWALKHAAEKMGLAPPAGNALVQRLLVTGAQFLAVRIDQQAANTIVRKIWNDVPLQEELRVGRPSNGTLARLETDALRNYENFKKTQVRAAADAHVSKSVRAGRDSLVRNRRVVKAERSEILDGLTCANCRRLDGLVRTVGDSDFARVMPPQDCLGGARCRGTLLFYLDDEENVPEDSAVPLELEPTAV